MGREGGAAAYGGTVEAYKVLTEMVRKFYVVVFATRFVRVSLCFCCVVVERPPHFAVLGTFWRG